MISLIPEQVDFRITATDLEVTYTESGGVSVRIDIQQREDVEKNHYREMLLQFRTVAELRCVTMNFFEMNHGHIEMPSAPDNVLSFWSRHGYHPEPGLYRIDNSAILRDKENLFDPHHRLGLQHYLIMGYDSHIEVISSGYEYRMIESTLHI
ncbi:hypothetical protein [Paenibacillus wulumuqiensis]|uniref:hypothetical protein n=1 Tax=Paenibacillus wulumuqiensis TaxID=1567107 RepID=UPI00061985AD|nr:hypothetical protein [Paenibacillus wulumuqiensis]